MTKKTPTKRQSAPKRTASRTPAAATAKTTTTKKTPPKAARSSNRKPAVQVPANGATAYQFDIAKCAVPRVVVTKAGRSASPAEFASFEEVKDRAIDFLIDYIADCEQQLWDLKRAESYEAYTALLADAERHRT